MNRRLVVRLFDVARVPAYVVTRELHLSNSGYFELRRRTAVEVNEGSFDYHCSNREQVVIDVDGVLTWDVMFAVLRCSAGGPKSTQCRLRPCFEAFMFKQLYIVLGHYNTANEQDIYKALLALFLQRCLYDHTKILVPSPLPASMIFLPLRSFLSFGIRLRTGPSSGSSHTGFSV